MKTNKFFTIAMIILTTVLAASAQNLKTNDGLPGGQGGRIEGAWMTTATFTNIEICADGKCEPIPTGELPPPFKVLFTFAAGRTENEGTLIDTNEFQMTGNPVCTPDQGVWERKLANNFVLTQYNFCFDVMNKNAPAGPTKIRASIQLNGRADQLTGTQYIEGFDTKGVLVFIGEVNLQGTRIVAE